MTRGLAGILLILVLAAAAAEARSPRRGGSKAPVQGTAGSEVPAHPFDLILGRPTSNAVTVSVLSYEEAEGRIAYGTTATGLTSRTSTRTFQAGEPAEMVLSGLRPDTAYCYRLETARTNSVAGSFHTARPPGGAFTFTVTADSHLDSNTDPLLYRRTLANARADAPDFHVDLGDTFMTEKHADRASAQKQSLAQRFYFGELCASAPLFLALGNHDGESARDRGAAEDSLSAWANRTRKRYFPNPVPDAFYSGNATPHPEAGLLQDYYAWTWGGALFVVLDPFWFAASSRGQKDPWQRTLGEEQYRWLARVLEGSPARLKLVFIHHLVGGTTPEGRGGAEAVPFYEWGGRDADGTYSFKERRPGWPMPIHDLLRKAGVSIVFHGHDHLFAREEAGGIVYQKVPQPGFSGRENLRKAAEYGYRQGVILCSPGHLRVSVSNHVVTVDYVRSALPGGRDSAFTNGAVACSYAVRAPDAPAAGP